MQLRHLHITKAYSLRGTKGLSGRRNMPAQEQLSLN